MDDLVPVFEQYVVGSVKWFYRFMTPPPVSPLFQPGGALAGYNEDVVFLLAIVVVLFFIDNLIAKRFLHPKARYFFLHAVVIERDDDRREHDERDCTRDDNERGNDGDGNQQQ